MPLLLATVNKEKLITISVGLVIGCVVAIVFVFSMKWKKAEKPILNVEVPTDKTNPTPIQNGQITFSVDSPSENFITKDQTASVSGTVENTGYILIISNTEEKKIAIKDGTFNSTLKLEEGENKLQIIHLIPNVDPVTITRTVIQDL
jgi:hypothetical protein